MRALIATIAGVFSITFLAAPTMGAGWFWDSGNALGFAAYGGLLYLMLTSARRPDVRAHQLFAYGVLFLAIAHVFWFLLGDAAAIEFVKPGAPDYMWLGITSLVLLGILVISALLPDRSRLHKNYAAFKYWHQLLAAATIASATYHIVVSNFYLATWYQGLLFVALATVATFGRAYWRKLGQLRITGNAAYALVSALIGALFVVVRNLPT